MGKDLRPPLRVLGADDSAVMRGVLRTLFELHAKNQHSPLPRMELCGMVTNGHGALEAVKRLAPDVLLLDLEMPGLNGLGVLERLRIDAPHLPVIMCSAYTERGAQTTLDALSRGAKDYVMKPRQQADFASALDTLMQHLLPKIAALAASSGRDPGDKREAMPGQSEGRVNLGLSGRETTARIGSLQEYPDAVQMIVIGVSTGGPSALESVLPLLPKDFAVPVLIVQHMPKLFTSVLAERLDRLCALRVLQATHGASIEPGTVWLAPGDAHMEIALRANRASGSNRPSFVVCLHQDAPLNSCKPAVDYLFRSAAERVGAGTLALIMTGMGADGLEGARAVRRARGTVLAQDQASSAVWGMPGRVAEAGLASAIVPLSALAGVLIERVRSSPSAVMATSALTAPRDWPEVSYGLL